MVIRELAALRFRNYREVRVGFSGGINLILGRNGQGKTNLAEGIYFLLRLNSFRTRKNSDLLLRGAAQCELKGRGEQRERSCTIRVEISAEGRRAWFNEQPLRKLSDYVPVASALAFSPQSMLLYRRTPAERRAFLDRLLVDMDPPFLESLIRFREAQRQKNRLLSSGAEEGLREWNQLFVRCGHVLSLRRAHFIAGINPHLAQIHAELTDSTQEEALCWLYRPSLRGTEQEWMRSIERAALREREMGYALQGPHRDDVRLVLRKTSAPGKDAFQEREESFFSQGEYRLALLALHFAISERIQDSTRNAPTLILDDLFSELDAKVRKQIRKRLEALPNQIFLTATEGFPTGWFPQAHTLRVQAGQVLPLA